MVLPLVIQVIITTGLGFPHAARLLENVHFQPLRFSGPLNQWRLRTEIYLSLHSPCGQLCDILMWKGESQLGEKLDFQQEVYDLFYV